MRYQYNKKLDIFVLDNDSHFIAFEADRPLLELDALIIGYAKILGGNK